MKKTISGLAIAFAIAVVSFGAFAPNAYAWENYQIRPYQMNGPGIQQYQMRPYYGATGGYGGYGYNNYYGNVGYSNYSGNSNYSLNAYYYNGNVSGYASYGYYGNGTSVYIGFGF